MIGDFATHEQTGSEQHRLAVHGELDRERVGEFEAAISEICRLGAKAIDVDLRDVTFIDSSGIRALISARERCLRSETRLSVRPSAPLRRVFDIKGLAEVLPSQEPIDLGGGVGQPPYPTPG
jgi:anti-anti-sigma factor